MNRHDRRRRGRAAGHITCWHERRIRKMEKGLYETRRGGWCAAYANSRFYTAMRRHSKPRRS